MNLKYTFGCICNSLTVNDIEEIDLTDEQRKECLNKIGDFIKNSNPEILNNFLQTFLTIFGEYSTTEEPCECCGDYIDTYELTI